MTTTDSIEDRNDDGTESHRKSTRTPTPLRRDSQRYPPPDILNFGLRHRVNASKLTFVLWLVCFCDGARIWGWVSLRTRAIWSGWIACGLALSSCFLEGE
jgi:hypothetical protein